MEQVQRFSPDMDEDRDRHNFFPVVVWGLAKTLGITLPETNSSPLKTGHPKRKCHLSTTNFQLRTVSFREGKWVNILWHFYDPGSCFLISSCTVFPLLFPAGPEHPKYGPHGPPLADPPIKTTPPTPHQK